MTAEAVRLPRYCPTWCMNDHQGGVNDGLEPEQCADHMSPDFGSILVTLTNPFTNEVFRPGGSGWWVQLFRPNGRDGWTSRDQITVELRQDSDTRVSLTFEPSEAFEFAKAVMHLAEGAMTASIKPTNWAPGIL